MPSDGYQYRVTITFKRGSFVGLQERRLPPFGPWQRVSAVIGSKEWALQHASTWLQGVGQNVTENSLLIEV